MVHLRLLAHVPKALRGTRSDSRCQLPGFSLSQAYSVRQREHAESGNSTASLVYFMGCHTEQSVAKNFSTIRQAKRDPFHLGKKTNLKINKQNAVTEIQLKLA